MSVITASSARSKARQPVVPSPHGLIRRNAVTNLHVRRSQRVRTCAVPRVLKHMLAVVGKDIPT